MICRLGWLSWSANKSKNKWAIEADPAELEWTYRTYNGVGL
jgi:hypothetical protein